MKFNCGKSREQKLREAEERAYELNLEIENGAEHWGKFFAWFPTRVGENDCRWLEYYEQRVCYYSASIPYPGDILVMYSQHKRPITKDQQTHAST